jgi:hypothetical protein
MATTETLRAGTFGAQRGELRKACANAPERAGAEEARRQAVTRTG